MAKLLIQQVIKVSKDLEEKSRKIAKKITEEVFSEFILEEDNFIFPKKDIPSSGEILSSLFKKSALPSQEEQENLDKEICEEIIFCYLNGEEDSYTLKNLDILTHFDKNLLSGMINRLKEIGLLYSSERESYSLNLYMVRDMLKIL